MVGVGGRLLLHQSNSWRSNDLILGGGGEGCPHPNLLGKLQLFLYCRVGWWGVGGGGWGGKVQVTYLCFQSTVVTANLSRISDNISLRKRQRTNIRKISDNAISDNFLASRTCRVVALSRKLFRAPSSASRHWTATPACTISQQRHQFRKVTKQVLHRDHKQFKYSSN